MKRLKIGERVLIALSLLMAGLRYSRADDSGNQIFGDLLAKGVSVGRDEVMKLPAPTLIDGLTGAAQRQRIEALAADRYTWEDLTRRSVMAPIILKTSQDSEAESRLGRNADLWFIAYGDLKMLGRDNFLNGQFKTASEDAENVPTAKLLGEGDLRKRGLPLPAKAEDPRYVAAEISLLDRVRVSGTTRTVKTQTAESIIVASILDPQFAADAEFPNRWRPISRDDAGRRQFGAPHSYAGLGSYVKATRLAEPQGALLIEYHVAYAEPKEWFNGANLLRSKLPIIAQTLVRQVRRTLQQP